MKLKADQKIITDEDIERMKTAAFDCEHEFVFMKETIGGGLIGKCVGECRCRFTSWPGTINYDAIRRARDEAPDK